MIVLNEERLSVETLESIRRDYKMLEEESVIERFYFDTEEFKKRVVQLVKDSLTITIRTV